MKPKRLPLWLGAVGSLFLLPGALWVACSGSRVSDDDASIALQPLIRIPLDRIEQGPISVTLTIPNTAQWRKIRKVWGEPEFVISAVDSAGVNAFCLPEMPVRIELIDRASKAIPLQPDAGPYGYSSACSSWSSLQFQSAPGNALTLKLVATRPGTVPAGDLIVVAYWLYTKDHILGLGLNKEIESLVKWFCIAGLLLVVYGAGIFFTNRHRHGAVD